MQCVLRVTLSLSRIQSEHLDFGQCETYEELNEYAKLFRLFKCTRTVEMENAQ